MLNDSLAQFVTNTEQLRKHIEYQKAIFKMLKASRFSSDESIKSLAKDCIDFETTAEKQFSYAASIVSLYGYFENFVESLCKEFVEELCSQTSHFSEYSNKIKKNYFPLWRSLCGKTSYAKFSHLSEEILVQNIHATIVEDKKEILSECFLPNGGNYKHSRVSDLFDSLGIQNFDNLLKYPPLASYLEEKGLSKQPTDRKVSILNDMVERRNQIAHGAEPIDILDDNGILEIVSYANLYACSLNSFLQDTLWPSLLNKENNPSFVPIIKTYRPGDIAELVINNIEVSKGQPVLVKNSETHYPQYYHTRVLSMKFLDKETQTPKDADRIKASGNEPMLVSLKLTQKISNNASLCFYL